MSQIFICHSKDDREAMHDLQRELQKYYEEIFLAPYDMQSGHWKKQIYDGLASAEKFFVFLSKSAIDSRNVFDEVLMALEAPHLCKDGCIVLASLKSITVLEDDVKNSPVPWMEQGVWDKLLKNHCYDHSDWSTLKSQLIRVLRKDLRDYSFRQYGQIEIPLHILAGGEKDTSWTDGAIHCTGPGSLPADIAEHASCLPDDEFKKWAVNGPLPEILHNAEEKNINIFNGEQIRLTGFKGGYRGSLDLTLGWTNYFATLLTNHSTEKCLPFKNDRKVWQEYQALLDDLAACRLSNPIAVNLSLVTDDHHISFASRGPENAWNLRSGIQPAISANANNDDLDSNENYDPFSHAIAAIKREAGIETSRDRITFFGLARTCKTRFPFLFGEARLSCSKAVLEAHSSRQGRPIAIPFSVDGVSTWMKQCYEDIDFRQKKMIIGTTLFSIMESCRHAFSQEDWISLLNKLDSLIAHPSVPKDKQA